MVYIQKNDDGIPYHFDSACAMYGTKELGLDYKLVTMEEVKEGKWDTLIRSSLFVGSVDFMTEVFKRIGINQPRLPKNNLRPEKRIKLSELTFEKPIFIKSVETKVLSGVVIDEISRFMLNGVDPNIDIIVQDVLPNILSEFRCYIFRNKLVDIRHYSGDLYCDTDDLINVCEKVIEDNIKLNFPETYCIDIAFFDNEEDDLDVIEFNDMWAIGNYGVPNDLYVRMLKHRYFEIIKGQSI